MRLCDFLKHFDGSFIFRLYKDEVMFREGVLETLNKECKKSFNILCGFDCELWEMQVTRWSVSNNIVYVELEK